MATPVWTTKLLSGNFDADFNKRVFDSQISFLNGPNTLLKKLTTVVDTKRPYWKGTISTLRGNWGEVAEGIQEAPPLRPEKVRDLYVPIKLVKGVMAVSREELEDDAASGFGYVQGMAPKFAERGPRFLELDITSTFINNGFTFNANRDVRDGVSLFNTAHPAGVSGVSYGNTPATQSALTETTLTQAIAYFRGGIYGDDGDLRPMVDTNHFLLIVSATRELYARQLVKSMGSTQDYKNAAVINPVGPSNGITIDVVIAPYQTGSNQWTLVPVGIDSGLVTLMRTPPSAPERDELRNPDMVQWQGRMRYGLFVLDPRMVYSNFGQ